MIKGMGKKTTRRLVVKRSTNALLQKVLGLCVEISTTTKADVFFEYMPHVDSFSVRAYEFGWDVTEKPSHVVDCADVRESELLKAIEKLEDVRKGLKA